MWSTTILAAMAWAAPLEDAGVAFRLIRSDVELRIDVETRRVEGAAMLELEARETVDEVTVSLNDLMKLTSVKEGGRPAACRDGANIREGYGRVVTLAPPLRKGKRRVLEFRYEGTALDPGMFDPDWMGVLLVRKDEVRMSHQAQWMPIVPLDAKARAKLAAPMTLVLDLPAGMSSLGPGRLVGVEAAGAGREKHTWTSERPVRASILAGTHQALELKEGGLSVRVLAYPDQVDGARAWAAEALALLGVLQGELGGPRAGEYGLASMRVRNRDRSYNYEADGFSVYDGVLFDGRAPDARKIAHEVAHRWFGGLVDATGSGERFLTESLAEVAAWLALEERLGVEAAQEAVQRAVRRYGAPDAAEHPLAGTTFGSPRYSQVAYAKGPVALWTLRSWVGEEEFRNGLREYVTRHARADEAATLNDFLDAMRRGAGDEVDVWAAEWVFRADAPTYRVELDARKRTAKGRLIQDGPIFHHPVVVELRAEDGKATRVTVEPRGRSTRFSARVKGEITEAVVDPDGLLIRNTAP